MEEEVKESELEEESEWDKKTLYLVHTTMTRTRDKSSVSMKKK